MAKQASQSVADFVEKVNDRYYLPAIQREFVWDMDQICTLFDSLARGYPIGTFLIWDIDKEQLENQPRYEFVRDYINEIEYPSEEFEYATHQSSVIESSPSAPDSVRLVLDGQQRLSAFNIGMNGSVTDRVSNRKRSNPDSWNKKELCINLLSDPDKESDKFNDQRYDFSFQKNSPVITKNNYYFPIKKFDSEKGVIETRKEVTQRLEDIIKSHGEDIPEQIIDKNLNAVKNVTEYDITYFEEKDREYSEVLEIFTRTNDAGTSLTTDQLLLSRMTARWMDSHSPGNPLIARQEVADFLNEITDPNRPLPPGFKRTSFILRSLQTCSDVSVKYSPKQYDVSTIDRMKKTWIRGEFQDSVLDTIDLLYSFDYSGERISNGPLTFSVVYYLFKNRPVANSGGELDSNVRRDIHYYLCSSMIYEVFNTDSTTKLNRVRKCLENHSGADFPLSDISGILSETGQSLRPDEEQLQSAFRRGSIKPSLVRSLLYRPDTVDEPQNLNPHSVFPSNLVKDVGEDDDLNSDARDAILTVANTVLINTDRHDISGLNDESSYEWFEAKSDSFKNKYYLPVDSSLYTRDRVSDFMRTRAGLIVEELQSREPI